MQLPQLQLFQDTMDFVFDTATMLVDDFSDEQRAFLSRSDCWRTSDSRLAFLQGPTGSSNLDSWLGLVLSQQPTPSNTNSSASAPSSQSNIGRNALPQTPSSQPSPRAQQAPQNGRTPAPQHGSSNTMRQMPGQQSNANAAKSFLPPTQFTLKYWELLPDQGNTGAVNDTAISLAMFGTKKA
jgi:hypothetical protein